MVEKIQVNEIAEFQDPKLAQFINQLMHQSQVNIENKFKVKLRYVPAKNLFIIIGQQSECDAALQEIHLNMETLQGLKVGEEHVPLPGAPNTKLLRYLATQRAVFNKIEL